MDPQACWDQLLHAIARQEWDEARELACVLSDWLARGGFPPEVFKFASPIGREANRALALGLCEFLLHLDPPFSQGD